MRKTPKRVNVRDDSGRKYLPRDNTKLMIIKYLLSKETDVTASLYEILHHSGISNYDYTYLKKIFHEMVDSGWIKIIKSGSKGKEKANYLLTERGRELFIAVKSFEKNHPIFDLDTFSGI